MDGGDPVGFFTAGLVCHDLGPFICSFAGGYHSSAVAQEQQILREVAGDIVPDLCVGEVYVEGLRSGFHQDVAYPGTSERFEKLLLDFGDIDDAVDRVAHVRFWGAPKDCAEFETWSGEVL